MPVVEASLVITLHICNLLIMIATASTLANSWLYLQQPGDEKWVSFKCDMRAKITSLITSSRSLTLDECFLRSGEKEERRKGKIQREKRRSLAWLWHLWNLADRKTWAGPFYIHKNDVKKDLACQGMNFLTWALPWWNQRLHLLRGVVAAQLVERSIQHQRSGVQIQSSVKFYLPIVQ